jgi:hypothetical protein
VWLPEDLQEVEPALAFRAGEEGEQLITDVGTSTIVPLVPCSSVVHLNIGGDRQTRRQEFGFLLVKDIFSLGQDATEFAGRDINAQLLQLFQQQGLGHMLVVVLVQDVSDQLRAEVAAGQNIGREGATMLCPSGVIQCSRR